MSGSGSSVFGLFESKQELSPELKKWLIREEKL
jgi:4-diphosphocytidyl-2C-methyl-D-erythritol kinase